MSRKEAVPICVAGAPETARSFLARRGDFLTGAFKGGTTEGGSDRKGGRANVLSARGGQRRLLAIEGKVGGWVLKRHNRQKEGSILQPWSNAMHMRFTPFQCWQERSKAQTDVESQRPWASTLSGRMFMSSRSSITKGSGFTIRTS